MKPGFVAAILALVILVAGLSAPARAGEAEAVIATFNDRLLDVMKTGQKLGFNGRVEKLRPAVAAAYDMAAMTRATLGAAAAKMAPEEALRLSDAYTRFSVATYAAQFDDWNGERFEVGEARASTQGAVIVPTKIVPKDSEPVAIDYLLREDQGRWRIVDVYYQGTVSQVAVRRSEFLSIYRAKGLDGLIETLDAQTRAQGGN
ncbi:ABC transporter substrate-binding protein [Magnetospirillum molischianum]|uniref:ABC-type transport system involved in resistance to organic solvents, auxiliary component n=1 Tax=Magnetospirillum molischianum DSM 120 TaxID=1150626 RepID=H8FNC0_MAGML|nr:ABC transporter substrate-binding protein [Magnetospirillum molischianum]CCG39858.1 ABC-type transport system involved in resistance to organic solvents, auxiliary component [Magnetospirillum molischianum DSM 120]